MFHQRPTVDQRCGMKIFGRDYIVESQHILPRPRPLVPRMPFLEARRINSICIGNTSEASRNQMECFLQKSRHICCSSLLQQTLRQNHLKYLCTFCRFCLFGRARCTQSVHGRMVLPFLPRLHSIECLRRPKIVGCTRKWQRLMLEIIRFGFIIAGRTGASASNRFH